MMQGRKEEKFVMEEESKGHSAEHEVLLQREKKRNNRVGIVMTIRIDRRERRYLKWGS